MRRSFSILTVLTLLLAFLAQTTLLRAQEELTPEEWEAVKAAEARRIAAIERVYGSVVAVYGPGRSGGGSGVVFHPSGLVLTNHHVIAGAGEKGEGGLADGKLYPWRLIGTDPGGDIAIIQLQGKDRFEYAPLGDSDSIRVGDWCMAMGNPFLLAEDQRPTVTLGVVSGVHRYQGGQGNLLVYGDCIQTDSSINPGNSGGPLFNLRGEVVGINGRGSFEERGRVNVGLGYAVSINQVKRFIPDLLATKVALHGTLDAQFATRDGKVICQRINLDGAAAQKAGLELGARLVSFEGRPIRTANQFTNLLSTYPAGWPAQFDFELVDKQSSGVLRLSALPINLAPPRPPMPQPPMPRPTPSKPTPPEGEPKDSPPSDKPEEPKVQEPKPDAPQPMPPMPPPRKPQPYELVRPGEAMFPAINLEFARQALASWKAAQVHAPQEAETRRFEYEITAADGANLGAASIELHGNGHFQQTLDFIDKPRETFTFDGEKYTHQIGDAAPQPLEAHRAWQNSYLTPAWLASRALRGDLEAAFATLVHEGSDKADGRIASRLRLLDDRQRKAYLWIDAAELLGVGESFPSKFSLDAEGEDDVPALVFRSWTLEKGLAMPAEVIAVEGLAETAIWRLQLKTASE